MNGPSISFWPLTQSLVLDNVEVFVDTVSGLEDPVPADNVVDCVDCEGAVEGELYTLEELDIDGKGLVDLTDSSKRHLLDMIRICSKPRLQQLQAFNKP